MIMKLTNRLLGAENLFLCQKKIITFKRHLNIIVLKDFEIEYPLKLKRYCFNAILTIGALVYRETDSPVYIQQ